MVMGNGVAKIGAERGSQIAKGYTDEHDDQHFIALQRAAQAYTRHAIGLQFGVDLTAEECDWPWSEEYWKPRNEEEDLVRAGALIAAALDSLDREKSR